MRGSVARVFGCRPSLHRCTAVLNSLVFHDTPTPDFIVTYAVKGASTMSIRDSVSSSAAVFKLDKHHSTERFAVITGIVVVLGLMLGTGSWFSAASAGQADISRTALYTPTFTTSKTQLTGTATGVYVSTDRKTAMLMMQYDNATAGSFSANAANYQAFLTGSDQKQQHQQLDSKIKGKVVVFGSTGYIGAVLTSNKPFGRQVLNLTMRANSNLVYNTSTPALAADLGDRASFLKYDQWRMFFNPGASKVVTTTSLNKATLDPASIYYDLVLKSQENTARSAMDKQLELLQVDLARIREFDYQMATTNVAGVKIVPPKLPSWMPSNTNLGDQVTGATASAGKASTLALKTTSVNPAGFNFDWRAGSIRSGYLNALVPAGQSYISFLSAKAALASSGSGNAFQSGSLVWKLTDGTVLSDSANATNVALAPLVTITTGLAQAYQTYYQDKMTYQVTDYTNLLNLEVTLRNVVSANTVNATRKAMFTY